MTEDITARIPAGNEKDFSCPLFYWKKTRQGKIKGRKRNGRNMKAEKSQMCYGEVMGENIYLMEYLRWKSYQ
ncbi:MAG: hypothetical protein ACYTDW_17020 [Planctomycetota bacterium]